MVLTSIAILIFQILIHNMLIINYCAMENNTYHYTYLLNRVQTKVTKKITSIPIRY